MIYSHANAGKNQLYKTRTFASFPLFDQELSSSWHCKKVQGSTIRRTPGLVNFVPALAYHFCLNLPATFTQPRARLLVEPCTARPSEFGSVSIFVSDAARHVTVRSDSETYTFRCATEVKSKKLFFLLHRSSLMKFYYKSLTRPSQVLRQS